MLGYGCYSSTMVVSLELPLLTTTLEELLSCRVVDWLFTTTPPGMHNTKWGLFFFLKAFFYNLREKCQ